MPVSVWEDTRGAGKSPCLVGVGEDREGDLV